MNHYMLPLRRFSLEQREAMDMMKFSLANQPLISEEEITVIFLNLEKLHDLHTRFLANLRSAVSKGWPSGARTEDRGLGFCLIAKEFQDFEGAMQHLHLHFARGYSTSAALLNEISNSRLMLTFFLDACRVMSPEAETLPSLLIQPIQRLPRYLLLLKEMIKMTKTNKLDTALRSVSSMISRVNEGVGKFEMVARLAALSEMWGEDLRTTEGAFARQVLYESEQKEGKEAEDLLPIGWPKSSRVFVLLLSDMLLLGKRKKVRRMSFGSSRPASPQSPRLQGKSPHKVEVLHRWHFSRTLLLIRGWVVASFSESGKVERHLMALDAYASKIILRVPEAALGATKRQPESCFIIVDQEDFVVIHNSKNAAEIEFWYRKLEFAIRQHHERDMGLVDY